MMQSTESWYRYSSASINRSHPSFATCRRSIRQRNMHSVFVIVVNVLVHEPLQMPFIKDDDMIEQIPATVADPALSAPVLPQTAEAGLLRLDAEVLDRVDHFTVEVCTAIEDQVFGSQVVGNTSRNC
jgi:hypothetical protein